MKWLLFLLVSVVQAQEFPQRSPLEITVLFPAGSSADVTARMLADGMSRQLNQRVLVVNRPGAGGAIGYKHVASQKPDGYSLVWNSNSISTTYHSGQLAFDYTAFDPVARVLVESVVLAVRTDAKWKTLPDLVADARARPKVISVGHSGVGSHTHLSLAALTHAAGVEANEVPFAVAQVVPSLLGGHVDAVVQFPGALAAPSSRARRACSPSSPAPATRRSAKCRRRASKGWTWRSMRGAALPCRRARRPPSLQRSSARFAPRPRAKSSPRAAPTWACGPASSARASSAS